MYSCAPFVFKETDSIACDSGSPLLEANVVRDNTDSNIDHVVGGLRLVRWVIYSVASMPFIAAVTTLYQGSPIWAYILMACIFVLALAIAATVGEIEQLMLRVEALDQSQQSSARPPIPEG